MARSSDDGVPYASLVGQLGLMCGQVKSWHLELLASGQAAALAQSKAEVAKLVQLRGKPQTVEGRDRGDAQSISFSAQWAVRT